MAFDQSKIGQLTAGLMDNLDADYDEGCEFGDLVIVAEVLGPHGSHVVTSASTTRKHATLGLLEIAQRGLLAES